MKEENTVKEKNYTCERKKNKNKFATEKEKGKRKMFKEKMSIQRNFYFKSQYSVSLYDDLVNRPECFPL